MSLKDFDLEGAIVLRGFCDALEENAINRAITGLIEALTAEDLERAVGTEPAEEGFFPFRARASMPAGDIDKLVFIPENFTDGMPLFEENPVILHNHDRNRAIGYAPKVEIANDGVYIRRGLIDLVNPYARDVAEQVRRKIQRGISIGVRPTEDPKFLKDGRVLFGKVQLLELTVTPVPANLGALIGKSAEDLVARARGGSVSATEDLVAEIVGKMLGDEKQRVDSYFTERQAEFDRHVEDQLKLIERRTAEAIELRLGTVQSLVERATRSHSEAEMVARALRGVINHDEEYEPAVD